MILEYTLDENDFLQHQLFTASKTNEIKKQRLKSWGIVTAALFCLGLLFLDKEDKFLTYYFLGFGLLSLLFYPIYQRSSYRKHYLKFIRDTYKNRFGQVSRISFNQNYLEMSSSDSESKINYEAFEEVNEIGEYIFLKLKSGGSLILPKYKIENIEKTKEEIMNISKRYNLKENCELTWKWK